MAADKILISRIDCLAAIGVTAEEQSRKQRLLIDLEFLTDVRLPARSDSIADAIDYDKVAAAVAQVCASQPFHLIETVAERIAEKVLREFPTGGTRVLVRKISPIPAPSVEYVSVEIVRP
jgi:7,8-dihydroneopterin aldolase/epimerase/oxygenase